MDWINHYSIAMEKNKEWRDLYALISGRKGRPSLEYMKKELNDNKDRIIGGLKYFQSQEDSFAHDSLFQDCGSGFNGEKTDITALFLMNKLHLMTGIKSELSWEVLCNYLQYAFRGPPDSLQKLLMQNEEKLQAVIADLFCFYYRERMFILKILYHILSYTSDDFYSDVFCEFVKTNIQYPDLYESLYQQLKFASEAQQPDVSCLNHLSASRYLIFWEEHNIRERVQLLKLMIISIKRSYGKLPPIQRINELIQLTEGSHVVTREESTNRSKDLPSKVLDRLSVIHFVQLLGFDFLTPEQPRWNDREVFKSINEKVRFLIDRKAEEGPAFLCAWFIVHNLTPLGTKSPEMKEFIALTVKASNPWKYFIDLLKSQDIMDDKDVREASYYAIYQVAFLSVVNFGLAYVQCDVFRELVALIVRDANVLKHFWLTENDGLQLVLKECERFFPILLQPVFDIYTSIASHSEFYVNQIETRVQTQVKFTQIQTRMIKMESLGNNIFCSLEPVQPFVASDKIIIPVGTRCMTSGDADIFIHWDYSVSIWHIVKETLYIWSQKMTQYPKPTEEEMYMLRTNVLSVLEFYNQMLRNRKQHKKIVFFAVDEMFSRIELYHERKDADMLNVCLKTCTLLLKYYPNDVIMLLEVSRAIPNLEKVVLDHIQCAKGDFYHSNGVKTILELVELNSGIFTVLVSYLEFILKLFELPSVFECWVALAGVQFVLRDVFPHYNQWIFANERQRIHIEWLCIQIISSVLNVTLEDIYPPKPSVIKHLQSQGNQALACILPTKSLFANTVLHHLLNWEPAIALVHVVSLGDQQLFSWVESYYSWDSKCCLELISSVYTGLSILNKCILLKHAHNDPNSLTRLEREIYKEPKETDTYRVVINVAGYVYCFLSPDLRYNSVKLISRFADNRHQSLMACIGMEANTMRQMYLIPLYSSTESEEIKIAVLELVTECIHKQASLAEAFLNALELKECVENKAGEESEGFVHIALSIIRKRKDNPNDRAFLASVQLLHALWHERRTLVISYIRMRDDFFSNFCYPLYHISEVQRKLVPAYAYILTCLGTEMYWYKDQVHSALQNCIIELFKSDHLLRLSLYCTDQLRGMAPEKYEDELVPTHTVESTKLLIAWKEFLYILVKSFPVIVEDKEKEKGIKQILCIHTLNALAKETTRQGNMVAISNLAELYFLLVSYWKMEGVADDNLVALKKISSILTQLSHYQSLYSESATRNILAACCIFFVSTKFNLTESLTTDWCIHMERIVQAVCTILSKEIEDFLLHKSSERTRQIEHSLLCLGTILGHVAVTHSMHIWRDIMASFHIASQLISAAAVTLQNEEMINTSVLILEFLSVLTRGDEKSFKQVDILELHAAWDNLKPPIQNLFGVVPVCLEEKSLFEATNWFPVYIQALNLVTALIAHHCPSTQELGFDFIYQHEKFICDIFEFRDDSLKETALDLVSSALRLLWQITKAVVPWNWKLKTTLGHILTKLKQYVTVLVDLLGDPDKLLKRKAIFNNQNTFPPPLLKGKDLQVELQYLQSRLLGLLIECISVLKESCPLYTDLLTADRLGFPMYKLQLLVEPTPPAETGPEYHTLINLTNLVAKRLASYLRISPRSSCTNDSCTTPASNKLIENDRSKAADENPNNSISHLVGGKEDVFYAAKLSFCSKKDLQVVLEMTLHYMIATTLLTILSDQMSFSQSIVFLRDLSAEAKTLLEYAQRLNYGKEEITNWRQKTNNQGKYKPLSWNMLDKPEIEVSTSLDCLSLPDTYPVNNSSSRKSQSPHSKSEKYYKKLKVTENIFLHGVSFDPAFEPKNMYLKETPWDQYPDINESYTEFILFCNNLLKQMFSMHGFDERLLRNAL